MKAFDTIRRFRTQVLDRSGDPRSALLQIRLLLYHLADAADFAQLADGKRLRDGLDFTAWLRELEACVVLELERDPRIGVPVQVVGKYCPSFRSPSFRAQPMAGFSGRVCLPHLPPASRLRVRRR